MLKTLYNSLRMRRFLLYAFMSLTALWCVTCNAAMTVVGVDGRMYFWGSDDNYSWASDALDVQRSIVQGAYIAPGRHLAQVASRQSVWRAAVDSEGDLYVMGSWPEFSGLPSLPSGAKRIPLPANVHARHVTTYRQAWFAAMSDGSILGWGALLGDTVGCSGCGAPKTAHLPDSESAAFISASGQAGYALEAGYALVVTDAGRVYAIGSAPGGYVSTDVWHPISSAARIQFPSGVSIARVDAGMTMCAALSTDGRLFVWGRSARGQLGTGSVDPVYAPFEIALPSGLPVVSVALGYEHALAVDSAGTAYAWGANSEGQLGDGTTLDRLSPVEVAKRQDDIYVDAQTAGSASSATTATGEVRTWGADFGHDLASGNRQPSMSPRTQGTTLPGIPKQIVHGDSFALALMANGDVYARGRNVLGQLGNNDANRAPVGHWVKTVLQGITRIAAASNRGAAIDGSGTLFSWGLERSPYVVGSDVHQVPMPVGVSAMDVAVGSGFTVVLGTNGRVYSWGSNVSFGLGTGDQIDRSLPTEVLLPVEATFVKVSSQGWHAFAIATDGRLFAWGYNFAGAMGVSGEAFIIPVLVPLPVGIAAKEVSAGGGLSLVLGSDNKAYFAGELWNLRASSFTSLTVPVSEPVVHVAASASNAFIRTSTGRTFGAGQNQWGLLGLGYTSMGETSLIELPFAATYLQLAASAAGSLAVTSAGDVVGWGQNGSSQMVGDFRSRSPYLPDCAFDGRGNCALGSSNSVSIVSSGSGAVVPSGPLRAYQGETVQFAVRPEAGYRAEVTGCGTTVSENVATTAPVAAACTVNVRFVPACTLDIDKDQQVLTASDGVLLLRAMFGFQGQAFSSGMSGLSSAAAIEAAYQRVHVPSQALLLDVDGDGAVNPMTDGLILVRAMLGLSGAALVADALGINATRNAAQIVSYIASTCSN